MFSLEAYKRLREELNQLMEGGNLMDEDEFLLGSISNSGDSKGVLRLSKELKEDGNLRFKQRNFNDAFEKYGYSSVILARYEFEDEKDMVECFDLAICILLNSTACFSKKEEFEHVGRICTIILDFSPENVKALF